MNPILPPVTSSSSSYLQQKYDDEMYAILPRIEIPYVLFSSPLDRESEPASSIDKDEPSLKHAHNHDTDDDANVTTKKTKRQHNHDCVHSDTSISITNNTSSSTAEMGSAFRSMTTATATATAAAAAQDIANNTEELGIEMRQDILGTGWLIRYDELVAFKQQYGHCNVPQKFQENKPLGIWVSNQRKQYRLFCQGKSSYITPDRIAVLEKIEFVWGLDKISLWETKYNELIAFRQQYGHCNVPRSYAQNKKLGGWVNTQRQKYTFLCKGKSSCMTSERIAALEYIGFEWNRYYVSKR